MDEKNFRLISGLADL